MRKIFLLTILAVMATFTNAQTTSSESDEILWGENLTNDISSLRQLHHSDVKKLILAVFVPGDDLLKGGKITSARVAILNDTHNASLWVKKKLEDESMIAFESIDDIKENDWNYVDFEESIEIPEEGLYVGFSFDRDEIEHYYRPGEKGNCWEKPGDYGWGNYTLGTLPIDVYVSGIDAKENNAAIKLPFTALTHLGLAMVTLIQSSKRLKTGTQYLPVDSIQTSRQLLSSNHCLKRRMSELKVEKRCLL